MIPPQDHSMSTIQLSQTIVDDHEMSQFYKIPCSMRLPFFLKRPLSTFSRCFNSIKFHGTSLNFWDFAHGRISSELLDPASYRGLKLSKMPSALALMQCLALVGCLPDAWHTDAHSTSFQGSGTREITNLVRFGSKRFLSVAST